MSCGVGCRRGLDPMLLWLWLWLWYRPVATAPIRPLAWESPYAVGVALKKQKQKAKNKPKKNKQKKKKTTSLLVTWSLTLPG